MKKIGVFSYQGAGHLFTESLTILGYEASNIDLKEDFSNFDGIILPGGESSAQYNYCIENEIYKRIKIFYLSNKPILGTCAGAILLSKYTSKNIKGLGLISIDIKRNFYGRQIKSGLRKSDSNQDIYMVRAPAIINCSKGVKVLDTLEGQPIFVKENNVYCTVFHPELHKLDGSNLITRIFST